MFLKALFTAIAFYLVSIGASFGLEDTGQKCESFLLVGAKKQPALIDNPPAGKGIGDVRAAPRALIDETINPIGNVHSVATLVTPGLATATVCSLPLSPPPAGRLGLGLPPRMSLMPTKAGNTTPLPPCCP